MYYHVVIDRKDEVLEKNQASPYVLFDQENLESIEKEILIPYLKEENFYINGYDLTKADVAKISIKSTSKKSVFYENIENFENAKNNIFTPVNFYDMLKNHNIKAKDLTLEELAKCKEIISEETMHPRDRKDRVKTEVFIVHGRDSSPKEEIADFIKHLGFNPTILSKQASRGKTIYEKLLDYSDKADFSIIVYTPCDEGRLKGESVFQDRARQNVIFEHGLMIGLLGRENVCAIVKGDIEKPSDIYGVICVEFDDKNAWKVELATELKGAGFNVDMNKVFP